MRITLAYNLRTDDSEESAELLSEEDVERLRAAIASLRHSVKLVEVSGKPNDVVDRLLRSEPDLIFNVAEGTIGSSREAFYPGLYEQLKIPFTGGNASLLHMNLDKHLAKTVLASRGVRVPRGVLITSLDQAIPDDLQFPLIIKPNAEGSSKGITQEAVVADPDRAKARVGKILPLYPAGLVVEEFIRGRELSVPFLELHPGRLLSIVEHTFDVASGEHNIYDYHMKQGGEAAKAVRVHCPATTTRDEEHAVVEMARQVFAVMSCPDFGRVDIRLRDDGTPFFIELNPLPSLHPAASLMTAAAVSGLGYADAIRLIIRSAAARYRLATRPLRKTTAIGTEKLEQRPTARQLGVSVGRMQTGLNNAITDVAGIRVGHWTRVEDDVKIPGVVGSTAIRTGVTAIVPGGRAFKQRLVAGGFILNGVGEMAGLTQVMEWGWLETPILLTNSHSVGAVHSGVVEYMARRYPELGTETDVVLPVVGETDDSFLNDVRVGVNTPSDTIRAIESARDGAVQQGSVGAGTGMITFDFAGGIGSSSRTLTLEEGSFTVGVLVLSNFGKMRNLTIDGRVVGRDIDPLFSHDSRRGASYGSIIGVVATDIPLLSSQLSRIAKRSALGLGRVGSYAASSSGEIILAFSTANRMPRSTSRTSKFINLKCVSDANIDLIYEATIEATEEAVLNAIFCSSGMSGRAARTAPPLPQDIVIERLQTGRRIHESH